MQKLKFLEEFGNPFKMHLLILPLTVFEIKKRRFSFIENVIRKKIRSSESKTGGDNIRPAESKFLSL